MTKAPRSVQADGSLSLESVPANNEHLLVVSNRQPYRHEYAGDGRIEVDEPAGGLTRGLDAVLRRTEGVWIAWGDGDADPSVVDPENRVVVPPDATGDQYTLERVWLSDEQVENYYYGFSNRVLWPVCHSALTKMAGRGRYWSHYEDVNEQFAAAITDSVTGSTTVWFHDYHLGLAPRMVRDSTPGDPFLFHTWHIPWPSWDVFRCCPHGRELLGGLLGNDLIGFHVPRYTENFLRCVANALPDAYVDWERRRIVHEGESTAVRAFPMGVSAEEIGRTAAEPAAEEYWERFSRRHGIDGDTRVGVGVDRLDYTKGIERRIDALERLWETNPRWREWFTYVQVGTESRSHIPAYTRYQDAVEDAVERVNDRFGTADWQPVVYTTEMLDDEELYALYRFADVGIVSPIRDGMNLVAQEYVAAQQWNDGVLVLSDQAGAHDELHDWVLSVNPHDTAGFASTVERALTLPPSERRARMAGLRRYVSENDIGSWIEDVFDAVGRLSRTDERGASYADV